MASNLWSDKGVSDHAVRAVLHEALDREFAKEIGVEGQPELPRAHESRAAGDALGKTKLAGEQAIQAVGVPHLIFRTSWVYGARGKNFLITILRLAKERDELRIVDDQIGAPTWSRTIAEVTSQVLAKLPLPPGEGWAEGISGIYNLSASGATSWHGFASSIVKILRDREQGDALRVKTITPIAMEDYPLPASRPKNSRLDNTKLMTQFGLVLPGWDHCTALCLEEPAS